ncbi:MAG: hypothetical protein MUE96_02610 [Bacteroidia bacterium]|jgi:hypothetical protein|nr:hypothetical protein [Bacteroidia bacterium]
MKQFAKTLLYLILCSPVLALAQLAFNYNSHLKAPTATTHLTQASRTKPASYTSLGYAHNLQFNDIIIGGTTTVYRKFGFFVNYKVGVQNFLMPTTGTRGTVRYQNAIDNNWTITGRTQKSLAFMGGAGLTIAITKKWPIYFGAGVSRTREFFEYIDPSAQSERWNENETKGKIELNYTAGTFIPLFNRVVLNIGYDHNPQCVFLGLCISSQTNFEDADDWWWGND